MGNQSISSDFNANSFVVKHKVRNSFISFVRQIRQAATRRHFYLLIIARIECFMRFTTRIWQRPRFAHHRWLRVLISSHLIFVNGRSSLGFAQFGHAIESSGSRLQWRIVSHAVTTDSNIPIGSQCDEITLYGTHLTKDPEDEEKKGLRTERIFNLLLSESQPLNWPVRTSFTVCMQASIISESNRFWKISKSSTYDCDVMWWLMSNYYRH